jgi:hypothetical protein
MAQPTGEQGTTTPPGGSTIGNDNAKTVPVDAGSTTTSQKPNTAEPSTQTFSQADVDRVVTERLNRERSKYADYDELKQRATQWDKFVNESKSDQEKALDEARQDAERNAYDKARREFGGQLVEANLRAAASGRMSDASLSALLAGVDKTLFLTEQGSVDSAKVTQFIDGIAPTKTPGQTPGGFGQGPRTGTPKAGIDAGYAAWEQRHQKGATPPLFT